MSRSAGGITNLTTALTGERIVGLHRRLQILVHDSGSHGGLESEQRGTKWGEWRSPECVRAALYMYIYTGRVCICARARRRCGVRRLVSKTSRAGVLEADRFDGYGLSRTGIDGDTQEAIWSSPV